MLGKINVGYKIIKSVRGEDYEVVLGEKKNIPIIGIQYVTWLVDKDRQGFNHGHYFSGNKEATIRDLFNRAFDCEGINCIS